MPYQEIPLGGREKDINSRKSRETLFNCYIESDLTGEFKRIRRAAGLKKVVTVGNGPIRGMKSIRDRLAVVSGNAFYLLDNDYNQTLIGFIDNDETLVDIETNGSDAGQILILSNGFAWVLDADGVTFNQVTDPNFKPDKRVAFLVQRMWFNRPDSNVFFASEVGDATSYNSLDFASADDNSDPLVAVEAIKSNLVLFGIRSIETWQTVTAAFPVRRITGATISRGVLSPESITRFEDMIFFLADDLTVRVYAGSQAPVISDLSFAMAVRGDGTANNPGYKAPEKAEGTFIDDVEHKFYVLTFPDDNVTWVYDVKTKVWHRRNSENFNRWRVRVSENFNDSRLVGDYNNGNIYSLDESIHNENEQKQSMSITTPSLVSHNKNVFISDIEAYMEVGDGGISNKIGELNISKQDPIKPLMEVEYSKNGGRTFIKRKPVSLGAIGDKEHKIIIRDFGYIKRHSEFVLRLTITDDIPINLYGLHANVNQGV